MKKLTTVLAIITFLSSCSNYYKAVTAGNASPASSIGKLQSENKYFILHNGTSSFAVSNISFTPDQKNMQCNLQDLPDEHKLHLSNGEKEKMIYKRAGAENNQTEVLQEVHLYIAANTAVVTGPYTLALDKIQKIEVIKKDQQRTRKSYTIGTLAVTGGIIVTAGVILAACFSSGMSSMHL